MKAHKIVAILASTVIFSGSIFSVAHAWGDVLYPGALVIDLKRFADSVKETENAVLVVQNTLKNLQNKIIINTGINSDFNNVLQSIRNFGNMPNGTTLVDPNSNYKNTPFWKDWDDVHEAMEDTTYKQSINQELSNSNTDATAVTQQIMRNQENRNSVMLELQQMETDGSLGEKQKANAIAILDVLTTADQARINGTQLMNAISKQEADYAVNRLDQEKIKAGTVYGYDPYNPSAFDKANKTTTSTSFGFLKFGE